MAWCLTPPAAGNYGARIGGSQPWMRAARLCPPGRTAFGHRDRKADRRPVPLVRGGCNYAVASQHLLCSSRSVRCRRRYRPAARPVCRAVGCSNSLIAADGLLNVPCFAVGCVCNYRFRPVLPCSICPKQPHGLSPRNRRRSTHHSSLTPPTSCLTGRSFYMCAMAWIAAVARG